MSALPWRTTIPMFARRAIRHDQQRRAEAPNTDGPAPRLDGSGRALLPYERTLRAWSPSGNSANGPGPIFELRHAVLPFDARCAFRTAGAIPKAADAKAEGAVVLAHRDRVLAGDGGAKASDRTTPNMLINGGRLRTVRPAATLSRDESNRPLLATPTHFEATSRFPRWRTLD